MNRQGVTLQDIAVRTGVSKVTVSYVLNDRETRVRISDQTRQRVLTAAREMGYYPNAVARALARRRTDTVTLVMQAPSVFSGGSGFINEMMHGVLDAANTLGYDLLLHTKSLPGVMDEVRALTDGRADGLLILRDLGDPLVSELRARRLPCVSLFSRSEEPGACFVDCDNVTGGRLATEYLLDLGHRRIGFISGPPASSAVRDRYQGILSALATRGLEPNPEWNCTITFAPGNCAPLVALMRRPDAPTALVAWSDEVALGAMAALRDELGLRSPEDVSIIGFDGTEALCERSLPRLTSVRQPIYDISRQAMRLLVSLIQGEPPVETQALFPPELALRDSCASPASFVSSSSSLNHPHVGRTQ
jgi:LacI family transcriptional regulator